MACPSINRRRRLAPCCRQGLAVRDDAMDIKNVLLTLNAGSSSIKFAVYEVVAKHDPVLLNRGQIEGIGTAPHFVARDKSGAMLAERPRPRHGPPRSDSPKSRPDHGHSAKNQGPRHKPAAKQKTQGGRDSANTAQPAFSRLRLLRTRKAIQCRQSAPVLSTLERCLPSLI